MPHAVKKNAHDAEECGEDQDRSPNDDTRRRGNSFFVLMKLVEHRRFRRFAQMFSEAIFFQHAIPDRRDDKRNDERYRSEDDHADRFGDDGVHILKFIVNQL